MRPLIAAAATSLLLTAACSSTPPRTIGGTVTGLAGSGLVLQDNGGDDLSVTADGPFAFKTALKDGSTYAVTVSQQPSNPAQVCTVSQSSTKAVADVKDVAVTCVTSAFAVSGTVTGLAGTGLVLEDNGGDDLPVTSNGPFSFATPVASGHAFTVTVKTQPSNPAQTCRVSGGSGTVGASGVSSVTVNCSVNRYAVGGTVSGLAGSGLVLQDNGGDDLPVSANGAFAFPTTVASGAPFAVTVKTQPTQVSQTCAVTAGTGAVAGSDVSTVSVQCTTNTYAVGGMVSGLAGSGLVLQDNLGDNLTVSGNGTFHFATPLQSGTTFSVTVVSQPTGPTQVCTVGSGSGSGTVADAAIGSVTVTCATSSFAVGGTVSGLAGLGLKLQNGSETLAVTGNGAFAFPTKVPSGSPFAVTVAAQPVSPSQTCTVAGGTGTVGGGDVGSITVNCTTNTYSIGGTVSGLAGTGLSLVLGNNAPLSVTANGTFAFPTPQASGIAYSVTVGAQPTAPWQTCTVANGSGQVGSAPVTNVAVTCVKNVYAVGGTVTGLTGSGLVLQDNAGDNLAVSASGAFKFATKVASGAPYSVTVLTQPTSPSQTCTVASGTGSVGGGDISNVAITCTTNTYNVSGTISGLAGIVVLQDNGGDNRTLTANGSFTFATRVASGATYAVTVQSQPSSPSQTCSVAAGNGTVTNNDVTTVSVTCVTNQYNVGGTVSGLVGTGFALQDNHGGTQQITSNGAFTLGSQWLSGTDYAVTVQKQPASPAQTCVISGGTGTVGGSDVKSITVNCTTNQYSVSANVTGLLGTGLTLVDNASDSLQVSGNGTASFAKLVTSGSPYSVTVGAQPTSPSQTCTVSNGSGTVTNANVTSVSVACVSNPYNVKVAVTGLAGGSLVLQDNGGDNLTVTSSGTSTFATKVLSGQPYNVTVLTQPAPPAQTCTVASPNGTMGGADVTVAVTCTVNTYSIGGAVSGLTGAGLVLTDNGGDPLSISGNGSFTFATKVASGQPYAVTIKTQPANQYCLVGSGSGTVGSGNVTTVAVQCGVAPTCLVIKQSNPSATTGSYTIVPDGQTAITAYCDMDADGGGWTVLSWTGNSANAPYGVPYPGLAYCPGLNCARGSAIPGSLVSALYSKSKEFAVASSTSALGSFAPIGQYPLAGKWTYSTLAGLQENFGVTNCSSVAQFKQGTFTNLLGLPSGNGQPVFLSQDLAYAQWDYSADSNSYIWSVGEPNSYCSGSGQAPGSYLGTWTTCNYPGSGSCLIGAFSVWVR